MSMDETKSLGKAKRACFTAVLGDIPADFEPIDEDLEMWLKEKSRSDVINLFMFYANIAENECLKTQVSAALTSSFLSAFSDSANMAEALKSFRMDAIAFLDVPYIEQLDASIKNYFNDDARRNGAPTMKGLIENIVETPSQLAHRLAEILSEAEDNPDMWFNVVNILQTLSVVAVGMDPIYKPIWGYSNNRLTSLDAIVLDDEIEIIIFAMEEILKEDLHVRRCKNCNSFFVTSRRDEIYCDRKLGNGKTCKTMSYETRIKDSPILREYRKIYKTQHARKQRNMHRVNIEGKFAKWKEFAEAEKQKCQAGEITLDEMITAISSADWMEV